MAKAKQEQKLFRLSQAAHELGLHPITVRRWIKAGRIGVIQVGREVRIPRWESEKIVGTLDGRLVVLYGRVSGHGQKGDRDTQLERLQSWAATERKGAEILVLSDIGSGLKAGRRQLQRLLKLICEDKVAEVVITYEDRLTRFGQEYLETLFACCGVTLTVLDPGEEKTPEQELTDDLLRQQAERKKAFELVVPILTDGFIRPRTEKRPAGKNRPAIKEAISALQ